MQNSLFPSDDELPTWLHTLLLILVVAPFACYLFWLGFGAIFSGHLAPIAGPDMGQTFFGNSPLRGAGARWAGLTLIAFGTSFVAIAYRFSRWGGESALSRAMPWALLALTSLLLVFVHRQYVA